MHFVFSDLVSATWLHQESEGDEEGEEEVEDEPEEEPENESPLSGPQDGVAIKTPSLSAPVVREPERQLSKKELKKKELAELDAVLAELGIGGKEENGMPSFYDQASSCRRSPAVQPLFPAQ